MKNRSYTSPLFLLLLGCVIIVFAVDTDRDGMNDLYEEFFRLNPTNSTDAVLDYDADLLENLQEAALWTDPHSPDTDQDGWPDAMDSNALSRAVIRWGHPDFTDGDEYVYTGPDWWLAAGKQGGIWESNAWLLGSGQTGTLYFAVDRGLLVHDLVVDMLFDDSPDSVVRVQWLDENSAAVGTGLANSMTSGTGERIFRRYALPLPASTNASRIALQARTGDHPIRIYASSLYIDQDGDGLDLEQEIQAGTLDTHPDFDRDRLTDYTEIMLAGTDPLLADTDRDGLSDLEEVTGSAYRLVTEEMSWDEARTDAEVRGGYLAVITSEEEQRRVAALLTNAPPGQAQHWIGGTDAAEEGAWTWVTGEPFEYARWKNGRGPSAKTNWNWLVINQHSAKWSNVGPSLDRPYLMERALATHPLEFDTDGDGISDGDELDVHGTNPLLSDTDKDGLSDLEEVTGSAYRLVTEEMSWDEARTDAEVRGGYLAVITSKKEQRRVAALLTNAPPGQAQHWIGGTDADEEGVWTWVTGEPFKYARWKNGRGPHAKTNWNWLVINQHSAKWSNVGPSLDRPYLMELTVVSDPRQADTDGDGMYDGHEHIQGSNPLIADTDFRPGENALVGIGETEPSAGPAALAAALNGSAVSGTLGAWVVDGPAVYAASRRGHVEYRADLSERGIFQVTIDIRQQNILEPGRPEAYRLRLAVDGVQVGRQIARLVDDGIQTVTIETPFLEAGAHVVRLFWDNYENDISLRVERVVFRQLAGTDRNGNGIADWMENRVIRRNTINRAPLASRTSPACLEGQALYPELMHLTAGTGDIHPGPDGAWYADIDLNPDGLPHRYDISFENNARTLSRAIRWEPTHVLTDAPDETVARAGDALLLTAAPSTDATGLSRIFVNGKEVISSATPQPFTFVSNGVYEVRGVFAGMDADGRPLTRERTIQVTVAGVEPISIAAMAKKKRPWQTPETWPADAVLELDREVERSTDAEGNPTLRIKTPKERYGWVRLGKDGPILAPVTIKGFNMWFMKKTYLHYDEVFEDGSFTASTTMIISPNLPEVWVDQRCRHVITYEDGSRARVFRYGDYSNLGEVEIRFIHPRAMATSVCHYTDIYQGDVLIGRSY